MQGHAGANLMPLVASNRIGPSRASASAMTFYGSSFIAGPTGEHGGPGRPRPRRRCWSARFDLDAIRAQRASWGLFRDRRPELYGAILTLDGRTTRALRLRSSERIPTISAVGTQLRVGFAALDPTYDGGVPAPSPRPASPRTQSRKAVIFGTSRRLSR